VPSGQPFAGSYPFGAFDPRLLYDHQSERWFTTVLDGSAGHAILAVSNGSDPFGSGGENWVSNNWKKYLIPFGTCTQLTDGDTLGVDGHGVYIGIRVENPDCYPEIKVAALPKAQFTNGTAPTVQSTNFIFDAGTSNSVFAAVNFEAIATNDPAWFLSSTGGVSIFYNKLTWSNGLTNRPVWEWTNGWPTLTITQSFAESGTLTAPQKDSNRRISVPVRTAITMATSRKLSGVQHLWTCRQVAVNSAGNNDAPQTNPADRWAVEWFKIQTATNVTTVATGRIWDAATTNQNFYYAPSLALNTNGDMLIGFSGSSMTNYASTYYWGLVNNGTSSVSPVQYFSGTDWVDWSSTDPVRWGDYSHTTMDSDGLSFWTIQEYAAPRYLSSGSPNAWGTRVLRVTPY
jgi:hypothetical protein